MKTSFLFLASLLCFSFFVSAQTPQSIQGKITTKDSAELTILNIYPATFPEVSVVFRAEKLSGAPVFNLTKDKMTVTENGEQCVVKNLSSLSSQSEINIALVIDESGSMSDGGVYTNGTMNLPVSKTTPQLIKDNQLKYVSPLELAKKSAIKFLNSFKNSHDKISLIGFSDDVLVTYPLTSDYNELAVRIAQMQPRGGTAFYDALKEAVTSLKKKTGVKIIVALTDGQDNESDYTFKKFVHLSQRENIPVYTVGLGGANKDTLQALADKTKGQFYFTDDAGSLNNIYELISKQVQAFYHLEYESPNFSSIDSTRTIKITFNQPGTILISHSEEMNLPETVIAYLRQMESNMQTQADKIDTVNLEPLAEQPVLQEEETASTNYLLWGGVAAATVLASGGLFISYRKFSNTNRNSTSAQSQILISACYPNPTQGMTMVQLSATSQVFAKIVMLSSTGTKLKSIPVATGVISIQFDMRGYPSGVYQLQYQSVKGVSNPFSVVLMN